MRGASQTARRPMAANPNADETDVRPCIALAYRVRPKPNREEI